VGSRHPRRSHKVKPETSATYQFIKNICRNYILLLTATPLHNDLRELYNLVTLLRPGQLGTWAEFSREYLIRGDCRLVADAARLRELTAQVMVRTRRSSVAHSIALPKRIPSHPKIKLSKPEAQLYAAPVDYLPRLYKEGFFQASDEEAELTKPRRSGARARGCSALRSCASASGSAPPSRPFAALSEPPRTCASKAVA
jgi:SNF2 family DNA or RNA helicase